MSVPLATGASGAFEVKLETSRAVGVVLAAGAPSSLVIGAGVGGDTKEL